MCLVDRLSHLNLTATLCGRYYYYPPFTDDKICFKRFHKSPKIRDLSQTVVFLILGPTFAHLLVLPFIHLFMCSGNATEYPVPAKPCTGYKDTWKPR